MIELEVHRNDQLLMQRTFYEPSMSLEMALKGMEMYIVQEELNKNGECLMRARFSNLSNPNKWKV